MINSEKNLFEVGPANCTSTEGALALPGINVLVHAIHAEDVAAGKYSILVVLLAERAA